MRPLPLFEMIHVHICRCRGCFSAYSVDRAGRLTMKIELVALRKKRTLSLHPYKLHAESEEGSRCPKTIRPPPLPVSIVTEEGKI